MEVIKDTPILKFNSNTLKEVRKELNLSNDEIINMLDSFEEWIAKQNHFTMKQFDRHYLETSILCAKGSLERAKKTLDKLCTLKTLLPNFFLKYDAKRELVDSSSFLLQATMPKLSKDNYRIFINRVVSSDFDANMILDFHRFVILMSEYVKKFDYFLGFNVIIDCRDVNLLKFVTNINILDLRNTMSVLMEGYGLRVKGIHLLSTSKTVDVFVNLLKQVVSAKIAGRIQVHKTIDTIYEYVPKEYLPQEYGGNEKTLQEVHDNWFNELSSPENVEYFRKISQARTDEKYRLTADYNDQILGMPGSFRTLKFD